jgi:hypothetical protein
MVGRSQGSSRCDKSQLPRDLTPLGGAAEIATAYYFRLEPRFIVSAGCLSYGQVTLAIRITNDSCSRSPLSEVQHTFNSQLSTTSGCDRLSPISAQKSRWTFSNRQSPQPLRKVRRSPTHLATKSTSTPPSGPSTTARDGQVPLHPSCIRRAG